MSLYTDTVRRVSRAHPLRPELDPMFTFIVKMLLRVLFEVFLRAIFPPK